MLMVFVRSKRDEELFLKKHTRWELVGFGCYVMGFDVVRGQPSITEVH